MAADTDVTSTTRSGDQQVTNPYPSQINRTDSPAPGTVRPRLTFLGTGYLGTTYAVCFADLGYEVLGFDIDYGKIAALRGGSLPFHEPRLDDLLRKNLAAGTLRFTTSYEEVAQFGDVHFLCVGTPQRRDSAAADLSFLEAAVTGLARHLSRRTLIVGKSTVPVGTADRIQALVRQHSATTDEVEVAWSPEFLQEGAAVEDVLRPNRIVLGVQSEWAAGMLYAAHEGLFDLADEEGRALPVLVTDFATAELVKVAANAFLATKISFINAMAEVCEGTGADVTLLAKALGYDPRIGHQFLQAGIGFGGGCLPKDIRAFQARAEELGIGHALRFLREVELINNRRRQKAVDLAGELLGRPCGPTGPNLSGVRAAVLGASFKPNSDDVRDSPALSVAHRLRGCGASVTIYDPEAMASAQHHLPDARYAATLAEAVTGADLVCVLTEWEEFRRADPHTLGALVARRHVIDGRRCLDRHTWTAAGWHYRAVGGPADSNCAQETSELLYATSQAVSSNAGPVGGASALPPGHDRRRRNGTSLHRPTQPDVPAPA